MRTVRWTVRSRSNLRAIQNFISQDSAHVAHVVVGRLIGTADRIAQFPEIGRVVPEFQHRSIREVIVRPYRVVYRLVGEGEAHILTVHTAPGFFEGSSRLVRVSA